MTKLIEVGPAEARRIAVRAQLLDGSAHDVAETVARLGFLQLDPIATVAPPQHVVLWSRLGAAYERDALDRLLWSEKQLFEWNAFLWPRASLPIIQARMRAEREGPPRYAWQRRAEAFLAANDAFRRYVLRELAQRGPLLSRELEDRAVGARRPDGWSGDRSVTRMLDLLHRRGDVAIVGRRSNQRIWGLAELWYPEAEQIPLAEAERRLAESRARALGVCREGERWLAHPSVADGPVPERATLLSPFDRLIHDRVRAEGLFGFRYRLEMYVPRDRREYGYYVLPLLVGDRLVGRAEPSFDRGTGVLRVLGAWGDTSRLPEALAELGAWLGATAIEPAPAPDDRR